MNARLAPCAFLYRRTPVFDKAKQPSHIFHCTHHHFVRFTQRASSRIPKGVPREILHPAECGTQWKTIQSRKDLMALLPCPHKFDEAAEKRRYHYAQDDRESPVEGFSFDRFHRVVAAEGNSVTKLSAITGMQFAR